MLLLLFLDIITPRQLPWWTLPLSFICSTPCSE